MSTVNMSYLDPHHETVVMQQQQCQSPPKKKSRNFYRQAFKMEWLEDPKLKTWLRPDPHDKYQALCIVCCRKLVNFNKSSLQCHQDTLKHQKNFENAQNGVAITPDPPRVKKIPKYEPDGSIDPELSVKKENNKQYERKYRHSWEKDFIWLTCVLEDDTKIPFCRICNKALQPRRSTLVKHARGVEHKSMEANCGPLIPLYDPSTEIKKEKKSKEYCDSWEQEFPWLTCVLEGEKRTPYCKYCNKTLQPKRGTLVQHAKGIEHKTLEGLNSAVPGVSVCVGEITEVPAQNMIDWNQIIVDENGTESVIQHVKTSPSKMYTDKKKGIDDRFTVYARHIANELRELTDPLAVKFAMHKINTVLYEAQVGNYNGRVFSSSE